MESRPTIRMSFLRIQPEYEDRLMNWATGVYWPLLITVPGYEQIDIYETLKENPQYPRHLQINYYKNRTEQLKVRTNPKQRDVIRDINTTWTNRSEVVWYPSYELMKKFRNEKAKTTESEVLPVENASIVHIEGYSLSLNDQEKYGTWLTKWGYELYVPWLIRLPGLMEYSSYGLIDVESAGLTDYFRPKRVAEYPPYLSILHFENIEAYENYEKSIELAGFRDHIKVPFPAGLDYKWYVQYQLVKSWRK